MSERVRAFLLYGLAGAVALFLLARTQRGQQMAADTVGAVVDAMKPRGIRNNNPGNLEWLPASRAWDGQVGKDGRFGVYATPAKGVRALSKQVQKHMRAGLDTLGELISTWAPPAENDTVAYIAAVGRALGVPAPQAAKHVPTRDQLLPLVAAIIKHENGIQPYSEAQLREWVYMA